MKTVSEDRHGYDGDSERRTPLRRKRLFDVTQWGELQKGTSSDDLRDITVVGAFDEDELSVLSGGETTVRSSIAGDDMTMTTMTESHTTTTTQTSVAVKMAAMQASFAERTAQEMKQIVDWYSEHEDDDRFVTVKQRQSLPGNVIASLDEDEVQNEDDDDDGDSSPRDDEGASRSEHSDLYTQLSSRLSADTDLVTTAAGSSTESVTSTMAASRTSLGSPLSSSLEDLLSEVDEGVDPLYDSQQIVTEQNTQIQMLLIATKFMEDAVLEYEQSSSSSDGDNMDSRTNFVVNNNHNNTISGSPSAYTPSRRTRQSPRTARRARRKRRLKKSVRIALRVSAIICLLIAVARARHAWNHSSQLTTTTTSVVGHHEDALRVHTDQCRDDGSHVYNQCGQQQSEEDTCGTESSPICSV